MEPGSRLGPYEIAELIGAGGMGEVYRASDTRLNRTVAIKVLPAHLASDVERRQRFEREARIISSPPRDIADRVVAAEWGADSNLAAIRTWDPSTGAMPIEFPLGNERIKTNGALNIRVAPDGKHLAFSQTPLIAQSSVLNLVSTSGETRQPGTWESITGLSFSPDGREIWLTGERPGHDAVLWAVTLDGRARVLARFPAEPVLHDVTPDGRALITTLERRRHMIAVVDGLARDLPGSAHRPFGGLPTTGERSSLKM